MARAARILIVDHDEEALIALERLLENAGYATEIAWGCADARKLAKDRAFDVVLVDENLANAEGDGLFVELEREQPKAARFLMSARTDAATVCKWAHQDIVAKVRGHFQA